MSNPFDLENLIADAGDKKPDWGKPKKDRGKKREEARDRATQPWRDRKPAPDLGIYDHLAMAFRDTDVYVPQGATLIAKLLRDRVKADARIHTQTDGKTPRAGARVQDVVEFMIKRFWAEVPNDQRTNALNNFLKEEWWGALAEESVNHHRMLQIPDSAFRPAGPQGMENDPFYDQFMAAKKRHPAGKGLPLRARLEIARAHHEQESN